MRPLDTLKGYGSIIALLLLVVCSAYLGHWLTNNHWQSKWTAHQLADEQQKVADSMAALDRLRVTQTKLDKAKADAKKMQDDYKTDLAAATASGDKLRTEIARAKSMLSNGTSGTIAASAAAATNRLVLAVVSERLQDAYERTSAYADELRQSVINCNAEYNAIRDGLNSQ